MSSTTAFRVGEEVKVRDLETETGLTGHMRAPIYCRRKSGTIERICGIFANPETLAYGKDGHPYQVLYRVQFKQSDLWTDYAGGRRDTIDIEIYEHWLTHAS